MAKEIVIDIAQTGAVEGMHFDNFDLGFLGDKEVTRASEIFFNTKTQKWDILLPTQSIPYSAACGFDGYDEAREFEVLWLQTARKMGIRLPSLDGAALAQDLRGNPAAN